MLPTTTSPKYQRIAQQYRILMIAVVFTARAMLALQALYYLQQFRLSVCLSLRLSASPSVVTRQYCVKTTARSMVQFAPLDSKMCLVL